MAEPTRTQATDVAEPTGAEATEVTTPRFTDADKVLDGLTPSQVTQYLGNLKDLLEGPQGLDWLTWLKKPEAAKPLLSLEYWKFNDKKERAEDTYNKAHPDQPWPPPKTDPWRFINGYLCDIAGYPQGRAFDWNLYRSLDPKKKEATRDALLTMVHGQHSELRRKHGLPPLPVGDAELKEAAIRLLDNEKQIKHAIFPTGVAKQTKLTPEMFNRTMHLVVKPEKKNPKSTFTFTDYKKLDLDEKFKFNRMCRAVHKYPESRFVKKNLSFLGIPLQDFRALLDTFLRKNSDIARATDIAHVELAFATSMNVLAELPVSPKVNPIALLSSANKSSVLQWLDILVNKEPSHAKTRELAEKCGLDADELIKAARAFVAQSVPIKEALDAYVVGSSQPSEESTDPEPLPSSDKPWHDSWPTLCWAMSAAVSVDVSTLDAAGLAGSAPVLAFLTHVQVAIDSKGKTVDPAVRSARLNLFDLRAALKELLEQNAALQVRLYNDSGFIAARAKAKAEMKAAKAERAKTTSKPDQTTTTANSTTSSAQPQRHVEVKKAVDRWTIASEDKQIADVIRQLETAAPEHVAGLRHILRQTYDIKCRTRQNFRIVAVIDDISAIFSAVYQHGSNGKDLIAGKANADYEAAAKP